MPNTTETRPDDWPSWAVTGDKTRPASDSTIATGFPQSDVPPSRQTFNWAFNQIYKGVRYLLQRGIPDWSATEIYGAQAVVQRGGLSYLASISNTGVDPATNPATWERWGFSASQQAAQFTQYSTTAQMNSAITSALAPYSTTTATNATIDSKILTQQSVQDLRTQSAIQAQLTLGNNLKAKSSRFALAVNDLVYMTNQGTLFTVASTAWASPAGATTGGNNAGSALIAETLINGSNTTSININDVKSAIFVNPADQSLIVLSSDSSATVFIGKYSSAGALVGAQINIGVAGPTSAGAFNIIQLSNGNIAAFWQTGNNNQAFAIFDTDLRQIVGRTVLVGPAVSGSSTNWIHAIALSGGGFAVAISSGAGIFSVFFGIYSNAGVAVLAMASIAGSSFDTNISKCAEMSNGNIAVVTSSITINQGLSLATFTPAGAAVLARTVIDTNSGVATPEISAVPGFLALGFSASGSIRITVVNNAGAVQGVPSVAAVSFAANTALKIRTDGTNFWLAYVSGTNVVTIQRIGVTGGASSIFTALTANAIDAIQDFFVERDLLMFAFSNRIYAISLRADGTASILTSSTPPTTLPSAAANVAHTFKAAGDFTMVAYSVVDATNAARFRVWRYLDVAILGVCQTAVAAGNPGTLVTVSTGPVAIATNPLTGPGARAFDHSGGLVPGNKGSLLQNSAALKGL